MSPPRITGKVGVFHERLCGMIRRNGFLRAEGIKNMAFFPATRAKGFTQDTEGRHVEVPLCDIFISWRAC